MNVLNGMLTDPGIFPPGIPVKYKSDNLTVLTFNLKLYCTCPVKLMSKHLALFVFDVHFSHKK